MQAAPAPIRLAVLPFAAPGLAETDRYLGLGIADAVIAQLGGMPRLAVRPTSTVRDFADSTDPVAAGRKLEVDAILEGLVQRDDDRLRISVQMVDVASGTLRWAERFERPLSDVFALQDAIAARVTSSLLPRLRPRTKQRCSPIVHAPPRLTCCRSRAA